MCHAIWDLEDNFGDNEVTFTREEVIQVIAEESGRDPETMALDAKIVDLDISSIDLASAVFTIEEKFGVLVEPTDIPLDATLGELVDLVMSHQEA